MASRNGRFFESAGVLPDNKDGFRMGLGTTDALLHVSLTHFRELLMVDVRQSLYKLISVQHLIK